MTTRVDELDFPDPDRRTSSTAAAWWPSQGQAW
jgi:hypothetical protein